MQPNIVAAEGVKLGDKVILGAIVVIEGKFLGFGVIFLEPEINLDGGGVGGVEVIGCDNALITISCLCTV